MQAIEAADIVLMTDEPSGVVTAIRSPAHQKDCLAEYHLALGVQAVVLALEPGLATHVGGCLCRCRGSPLGCTEFHAGY